MRAAVRSQPNLAQATERPPPDLKKNEDAGDDPEADSSPEGLNRAAWQGVLTAIIVILYLCVSGAAILINKHILVNLHFPFPVTISWLGLLTTTLASTLAVHVWLPAANRQGVTARYYVSHVLPVGFFMAVAFLTGNLSFLYLTLAFVQMLKASTPVVTMLLLFAFRLEKPTAQLVLSVCVICAGVCVAGYGELNISVIGIAAMLTSVGAESLRLVLMQFLMDPKGGELHPIEGLMYISSACCLWLTLQAAVWEWSGLVQHQAYMTLIDKPIPFVVSAFAGFGVNLLAILVIKRATALTLKVLGTVKDAALVLISVVLLHEQVGGLQLCGYTVSLIGFAAYNVVKARGPMPRVGHSVSSATLPKLA